MAESDEKNRSPYSGSSRKLVISFDVGTTFTAASFCILQPGKVPKFEEATPDAKVPSVLYYDKNGKACAFGAETDDEDTIIQAESDQWRRVEWWKLHLRPAHLPIIRNLDLPPLPPQTTVDDIFADHFRYVNRQIQEYITATYADGANIWNTLSPTKYVILTTPNGWEGSQQNRMRQAAIRAGLVDAEGGRRVRFVTEAEAAVLYAADSGSVGDWLIKDGHLILCDCGGGTIDITGYKITNTSPLQLEESSASRCYLAGAVFVTQAAKAYLKKKLKATKWDNTDSLNRAFVHFDKNAKRKFDDPESPSWVQLDGFESILKLNIVRGRLKISGKDMISLFANSLKSIKEGLEICFENGHNRADKVILVGGLASSPYIYSQLVKWGEEFGISVSRPDGPTVKAVANGALAWHIDATVSSRVAKFHFGTNICTPLDEKNKEHRGRHVYQLADGISYVGQMWSCIVEKGMRIESGKEFTQSYCRTLKAEDTSGYKSDVSILAYRRLKPPVFITFPGKTVYQPGFECICKVRADLEKCFQAAPTQTSPDGAVYKDLCYDVCISLGETEISARIRWEEDGVIKYGPATVAYD